ncbi:glucan phosphoethanolaminetransferase (alkaline phosphatase superfamily) [Peribacillus deserti]|uniref:Glucan phosphoethanolaminetransferase (Alkaline phosphatase superfamily) n=1 Tax=Peribacillus deserti TaxID=673318 RepID=A0ABS2QJN5_9BACI|nr:hypothetical protein [Peribacillus deserti]MBM7693210.1 glucan phosphoethanolaminetransferase (alkaline phosphatase superfamily) [Peribacillus deserti]
MKTSWLILTLIPAPFLFHFFEYGQHIKREEASFLYLGSVIFVIIIGLLSGQIRIRYVILVNVITGLLSMFLAMYLIPNDGGWFKPAGRDVGSNLCCSCFFSGTINSKVFFKTILC